MRRENNSKNWGGSRKGAGRPAIRFTVREGQQVLVRSVFEDGVTQGRLATVALRGDSRNRTIELDFDDGEIIVIGIYS